MADPYVGRSSPSGVQVTLAGPNSTVGIEATGDASAFRTSGKALFSYLDFSRLSHHLKPKDLVPIPWLVALALQADDWFLRSEIVWAKKSTMPQSVTDRPTSATERIYLLTKRPRYFYDRFGYAELAVHGGRFNGGTPRPSDTKGGNQGTARAKRAQLVEEGTATRNLRDFWLLGPEQYAGEHYAVFPPEIPRRAIRLGTSAKGVCSECGAPWARTVEKHAKGPTRIRHSRGSAILGDRTVVTGVEYETKGWRPTCDHADAAIVPATVLDPFSGAGTTGVVAVKLGRRYIGIELNPEYVAMSKRRIAAEAAIGNTEAVAAQVGEAQLSLLADT